MPTLLRNATREYEGKINMEDVYNNSTVKSDIVGRPGIFGDEVVRLSPLPGPSGANLSVEREPQLQAAAAHWKSCR
jgi:hypothetical protein